MVQSKEKAPVALLGKVQKIKSGGLPELTAALIVHHSANGVNSSNRQRSHELLSAVLRSVLANELLTF